MVSCASNAVNAPRLSLPMYRVHALALLTFADLSARGNVPQIPDLHVMTLICVADTRGSMSVMWRAEVPVAIRLREGMAQRESSECPVVRVSTHCAVGRSQVLRVWSCDAEYATVASSGLKMTLDTGELWPVNVVNAPLAGTVRSGFESFWRLFEAAVEFGRRLEGATGFSFALLEKSEMVLSEDALRMRLEGPWTAISSTPHRWLKSSRLVVMVRVSSSYLNTRTVLSMPAATIFLSDSHFADFKLVMRPPLFGASEVARTSLEVFHTLTRPS
ncbi:hypothetical protein HBH79_036880 [Parastagonospora nodorum]|nr:hypothetical protein HBH50_081430 [Parastagonospora nodorum]KAH4094190.1 hypothetical protein HBH48_069680 [Parastagonospora nodorum]KAH4314884.1 hypothetical protein HBI02_065500 [Parastagonospora nodorum]KAH4381104.1 hypothetical protein HBH94_072210 [Parastagonospora nodorum]KAH4488717.1 hypothetical protein HBH87_225190 [Parastagonospora nodorum]